MYIEGEKYGQHRIHPTIELNMTYFIMNRQVTNLLIIVLAF